MSGPEFTPGGTWHMKADPPTTAAGRARRWAVFEDEDHVFRAVTEAEGDDISWPEMGEDDVERMVDEHNAAIAEARAAALDEARAAVEQYRELGLTHILAAIDALREGE